MTWVAAHLRNNDPSTMKRHLQPFKTKGQTVCKSYHQRQLEARVKKTHLRHPFMPNGMSHCYQLGQFISVLSKVAKDVPDWAHGLYEPVIGHQT